MTECVFALAEDAELYRQQRDELREAVREFMAADEACYRCASHEWRANHAVRVEKLARLRTLAPSQETDHG